MVGYNEVKFKKDRTYIGEIVCAAKKVPGVGKYSQISNWSKEVGADKGIFTKDKRVTLFAQLGKESKRQPGPGAYNGHTSKDKMVLLRTLGTFKE